MKLNRLAIGALGIGLLAATNSNAADITYPAYDWSGPYLGLTAGFMSGIAKTTDYLNNGAGPLHAEGDPNPSGIFGGLYAGYNFKTSGKAVFGVEADVNYGSINGTDNTVINAGGTTTGFIHSDDVGVFGAGRLRLGYDAGRFMPYLAGGIAFASDHANLDHSGDISNNYQTLLGWTAGAGVDYALSKNLVGRLEYRYTDYGALNGVFENYPSEAVKATLSSHTVQIGLAYRF